MQNEPLGQGKSGTNSSPTNKKSGTADRPSIPKTQLGFCVWFTGLPSAGKSTIAELLTTRIKEFGHSVTLLDGDAVRKSVSKGLGFSKEDRDTNIRRIGYLASDVVGRHGVAITAAISPYQSTREEVREIVGPDRFILVFVDTPLYICEQRDVKGMYSKARRGEIKDFTGVDDPYEPPANAEIVLNTTDYTPEGNVRQVFEELIGRGYLQKIGAQPQQNSLPKAAAQ